MRAKLTYANVMSSLALFLVLGGVSWAAVKIPRNAVGAKQIKTGAVGSEEVADKSLLPADLAPGALPAAGPKGDTGPAGPGGAKGDTGPAGEKGADGAPPCDHLMCPNTDTDGKVVVTFNGNTLGEFSAFTTECENAACAFWLGRKTTKNIEFDASYELTLLGSQSKKSLAITLYDENGAATARWNATDAYPVAATHLGVRREQFKFTTAFLQRVAI